MSKDSASTYPAPYETPANLLWQVSNLQSRLIKDALLQHDLTAVQFYLLMGLGNLSSKYPDGVTQIVLARTSGTDKMMTSKVARSLEIKGFVSRVDHPYDTRAKLVKLTIAGDKMLHTAARTVASAQQEFFETLGKKQDKFFECLVDLLKENFHKSPLEHTY